MTDLTKLTAEELCSRIWNNPLPPGSEHYEIRYRLERLEQCEETLRRYANEANWFRSRPNGPIDTWECSDEDAWNGPDLARAAVEGK